MDVTVDLFDAMIPETLWECDQLGCVEEIYADEDSATAAGWKDLGESLGRHFGTCPKCLSKACDDEDDPAFF